MSNEKHCYLLACRLCLKWVWGLQNFGQLDNKEIFIFPFLVAFQWEMIRSIQMELNKRYVYIREMYLNHNNILFLSLLINLRHEFFEQMWMLVGNTKERGTHIFFSLHVFNHSKPNMEHWWSPFLSFRKWWCAMLIS